jgi:heme-degrading monooxygenase HmoA
MTATFRVLLRMDVPPAHVAEFEAAWSQIADRVASNPASLGQALMRGVEDPGRYYVVTDWTDESAFRSFERSPEHEVNRARLAPYRTGVAMTTMHLVAEFPGKAA